MRLVYFILLLILCSPSWAQEKVEDFKPPVTQEGEEFKSIAGKNRQYTDVEYLHPDQKLDAPKPKEREQDEARKLTLEEIAARAKRAQIAATIVLVVILLIVFLFWLNNRTGGKLFARFRRKDRFVDSVTDNNDLLVDAAEVAPLSLAQLSTVSDPKQGLHDLLIQALLRATEQNKIPLRRSLTTRDVLRQIPANWPNRDVLHALANRCELVFFGGRSIDQEGYQQALVLAQPLFSARGKR